MFPRGKDINEEGWGTGRDNLIVNKKGEGTKFGSELNMDAWQLFC